ncbi:hypothetical protein EYC84_004777 [Monilinia fructicola]|uniref:DUF7918 domain-containing protein n=2 Tax=Monilinia fructicola TaxID=38448 RepID=A0A5M9K5B6_MONFR|nr:hypothetical protein EYC84_004777 [Monilinia fructicola]
MPKLSNNLDPDLPKGVHVAPVPGITVQIISQDKKAFPNHVSPDKEPTTEDGELSGYFSSRTITTYIAVTNDTPFSIHLRVDRPYPVKMDCSKLQFEISIDGKFVWDAWCHRPRYHGNGSVWEEIISGMKLGKGRGCEIKDFKFMGLKTNDACPSYTTFERIRKSMEKIGNIEIKVYRTMNGKKGGDVKNSKKGFLNKNSVEVPEKALKGAEAKSHGTALDAGRRTTRGDVWRDATHHGEHPIAIFRFLYRSEEALKSLHIIDRTPKPSRPSSPDSDCHSDGGLTAAQAKQVEDLMKAFRKKVGAGGKSSSRKRIKREDDEPESSQRVQKRRRVEKVKGKAVVDLTGGDSEDEQNGEGRVDEVEQTSNLVMSDKRSNFVKLDDDDERENLFVLDNPEDLIDLEEILLEE